MRADSGAMWAVLLLLAVMALVFWPAPRWASRAGGGALAAAVADRRDGLPAGMLDDYVRDGLDELRVYLAQQARRRDDCA